MIKTSDIQSRTVLRLCRHADVTNMSSAWRTFVIEDVVSVAPVMTFSMMKCTLGGGHRGDVSIPAGLQDGFRLNPWSFYHTCEYNTVLKKNAWFGNCAVSDFCSSLHIRLCADWCLTSYWLNDPEILLMIRPACGSSEGSLFPYPQWGVGSLMCV